MRACRCLHRALLVLCSLLFATRLWAGTPYSFTLTPDDKTAVAFFVTKPGPVTAVISWDGPPLTLYLQKPSAAVLPNSVQDGPSARLTAVATAADVARGACWRVVIQAPTAALFPREHPLVVRGRVLVSAPPISAAVARQLVQRYAVPAVGVSNQARFVKALREMESTAAKARRVRFTARAHVLQEKFALLTRGKAAVMAKSSLPPVLTAVTPAAGVPGTCVTVAGAGLSATGTKIFFILNPGVTVEAKIRTFTPAADGTATLQVQVPNKAGLTQPFDGQLYATVGGNPEASTPPRPFHFTPALVPGIAGITPAVAEPGTQLTLVGFNFAPDAEVHLVLGDGRDLLLTPVLRAANKLTVTVPAYTAAASARGLCYLRQASPDGPVSSEYTPVTLLPTETTLSAVEPGEGEVGQTVLLTGTGFKAPITVLFRPNGGSRDYVATPARNAWSECALLVTVPAFRDLPMPYGDGTVTVVVGGARSTPRPFRIKPSQGEVLYRIEDRVVRTHFAKGEPGDLWRVIRDGESPAGAAGCLAAVHRAGLFTGQQGDDTYVINLRLQPGWTLSRVLFRAADSDDAAAECESWQTPEGYTAVKVHWWTTPCRHEIRYTLGILVKRQNSQ